MLAKRQPLTTRAAGEDLPQSASAVLALTIGTQFQRLLEFSLAPTSLADGGPMV
jgi:hypothetical protein